MRNLLLGSALFLSLGAVSGAASADTASDAVQAVQQKFYEITGQDTTKIKFNKGSSDLPSGADSSLQALLNAVQGQAPVKEVLVIAYSDIPYPHGQKGDLGKDARALADKRGDAVKRDLSHLGANHIKVYNMAEKANWFEKTFKTSSAEIKREAHTSAAHTDQDDAFYEALGKRLKTDGGPGGVVVVVRHEGSYAH